MNKYEFSLLWLSDNKESFCRLPERTVEDLNLNSIIERISRNRKISSAFRTYLTTLPLEINVIRHRQNSFEDIMENLPLRETLTRLLPYLSSLLYFNGRVKKEESGLFEMIFRINELDRLLKCVDTLDTMFKELVKTLKSDGFIKLKMWVDEFKNREYYASLKSELPVMMSAIRNIQSISLGINLNSSLMPSSITIEKVNNFSFTGRSSTLINSLFKGVKNQGLTPLLSNEDSEDVYETLSPYMRKISKLLSKAAGDVINRVKDFRQTNSNALINIKSELDFLLEASKLFEDLKKENIEISRPVIYSSDEKIMSIRDSRNLDLVLTRKSDVVASDVNFNNTDSFSLITGPNSGGKTVFLQSLGLNQILAQTGLYVLGSDSRISMVDNIYTHYQIEEAPGDNHGRFGVEIKRLKEILPNITAGSLLLFNETFSSTNAGEALYIAEDILRYICEIGSRGAFTTHMHILADKIPDINLKISKDTKLFPMTSRLSCDRKVTYKIVKGSNDGYSYAMEMAGRMNICFDKLMESNIMKCGQKR